MYPALAIAAALARSTEVLWIGSEGGMEAALVQRAKLAFESVPAAGLHGVGWRALPGNLARTTRGLVKARRLVRAFKPDAVLLTGGFVGVPVSLAAPGVPKLVFVPDIEPGQALRLMCRLARTITVSVPATRKYLPGGKRVVVTGYPTRAGLDVVPRRQARAQFGLSEDRPVLLVFGGSKGARSINQALWRSLGQVLALAQVLHITGELDWPQAEQARASLPSDQAADYHAFSYLHDAMGAALAAADLAVARAGASTLGELPLFGLPAILVPYPHAWRYQQVNAEYLVMEGGAVLLDDADLAGALLPTIDRLLGSPAQLDTMRRSMRALARPQAAAEIAAELERLLGGEEGKP